jgi:hypothetical protein
MKLIPCGVCEIAFGSEGLLRNVKCAAEHGPFFILLNKVSIKASTVILYGRCGAFSFPIRLWTILIKG